LLELAHLVPPPQFPVNVLLASVHDLLLGGVDHELASHYRSVAHKRGLEYRPLDASQLVDLFEAFCRQYHDGIAARCATRTTQTNEVGRCAALCVALAMLGDVGPLALLDVGCAAGLNLFVDAYGYDYGEAGRLGSPGALPVLGCELFGATPPPLRLPDVASRTGLDQSPIDVRDPDELRWLLACLWPDDLERFERLDAAASVGAARHDEIEFVEGDMVDHLAAAAAHADPRAHLVVVTTWSTAYLPTPRRSQFAAEVAALAERRDLTWVTMEHPTVARELGVLARNATYRHRGASVVCVTRYRGRTSSSVLVAETHAHGRWLDLHELP
jgi:hypothetical protein